MRAAAQGLLKIARHDPAEGVDGHRRAPGDLPESFPAERDRIRVRRRRVDRPEHDKIHSERLGPLQLLARMARSAAPREIGAGGGAAQLLGGEVHAVGADIAREREIGVDEDLRAVSVSKRNHASSELLCRLAREGFFTHLDQLPAAPQSRLEPQEKRLDTELAGTRDGVFRRQLKAAQHRAVGRQERGELDRVRALPGGRLVFERARLPAPSGDPVKMQAYFGMRIGKNPGDPGVRALDLDAELLAYLALERLGDRLTWLDLAAGKLPVARVDFAGRTLRGQHGP